MAGQTNCWILPEGDYGAYKGLNSEIFILTARSARNLAFQDKLPKQGEAELLLLLKGQDLIGVPLKVILGSKALCLRYSVQYMRCERSQHAVVYILKQKPMSN